MGDFFLGGEYISSLKKWNHYDTLSETSLAKIQSENLQKILLHTSKTVPFYQRYFAEHSALQPEQLSDFPILTKELLRAQQEALVSDKYDVKTLHKNYSSGSSGVQSFSYVEKKYRYYIQGLQGHWFLWSGYRFGDSIMQFGISPNRVFPKNIKDWLYHVSYQNSFSLSERDLEKAYHTLVNKKIKYIIGYPSAIHTLAKWMLRNQKTHALKAFISLGDKLFEHFKSDFEVVFHHPTLVDTYGCAEGLMMGCSLDHPYYYEMSPHVYIEIVDVDGKPVKDGELGSVLVTSLTNFAMPMIRYKLGDLAIRLPKEKYPKQRKFQYPLLEKIVGRETDVVLTTHGKTLVVHSFTGIVEYFPEIKQYQILQRQKEEIDFLYITDEHFGFSELTLENIKIAIDQLTEGQLHVNFIQTKEIAPSPSGKPQIIVSELRPFG
ncbi:MAG: AMP-binding protein [Flavobacterium sp.]